MSHRSLLSWLRSPLVHAILRERDGRVLKHGVRARALTKWEKHLPADASAARAVAAGFDGQEITRSVLKEFAEQAIGTDDDDDYLRLFMACQLWGVGRSGRMHHTATTLREPALTKTLRELAQVAMSEDPAPAAGQWAAGWNTAFTTKFAYAVALAQNPTFPRALIYDRRVKRSLRRLEWSWREIGAGSKEQRQYRGYLHTVRSAAYELSVRPDSIEWLLFDPRVDLIEVRELD